MTTRTKVRVYVDGEGRKAERWPYQEGIGVGVMIFQEFDRLENRVGFLTNREATQWLKGQGFVQGYTKSIPGDHAYA